MQKVIHCKLNLTFWLQDCPYDKRARGLLDYSKYLTMNVHCVNNTSHEKRHLPPAGFKMRRSRVDRLWRYRERVRLSFKMANLPKTQSNVAVYDAIQLPRAKAATVVKINQRVCGDLQCTGNVTETSVDRMQSFRRSSTDIRRQAAIRTSQHVVTVDDLSRCCTCQSGHACQAP